MAGESLITARSWLSRLLGKTFGGKRDLYEVFGYKRELFAEDFHAVYLRNDIAQRIIKAYPQATWRRAPRVRDEAGSTSEESDFVAAWEDMYERQRLGHFLERADRLSCIGYFGLLYVGVNDGKKPYEPLEPGKHDLLYLSPYGEQHVTVTRWDMRQDSPRFGMPYTYTVQTGSALTGPRAQTRSIAVHHSRVIHIAEILDEDDVYGVPRLMSVYNRLQDLEKLAGGSAETFWLIANRGIALLANEDARMSDEDKEAAKQQAEEYQHQLRRVMTLQGMDVKSLGSETPDPSTSVGVQVDLIAGATGIPKRILLGNEAGELASTQDETNWSARIDERRRQFAGPSIVRPFVQMMIDTGNLPEPQGDWWCEWDEDAGLSEKDKAEILLSRSQALQAYTQALGAEDVIPRTEWRELAGLEPEPEGGFEEVDLPEGDDEG